MWEPGMKLSMPGRTPIVIIEAVDGGYIFRKFYAHDQEQRLDSREWEADPRDPMFTHWTPAPHLRLPPNWPKIPNTPDELREFGRWVAAGESGSKADRSDDDLLPTRRTSKVAASTRGDP